MGWTMRELSFLHIYLFIWISWILYRTFTFPNRPTLEEISAKFQGEDKDALKKRNHRERLKTALIYVPSVPIAAVIFPPIFVVFLLVMNALALQEYLSIVAVRTDEEKRKEKEKGVERLYKLDKTDRFLQLLSVLHGLTALSGRWDIYTMSTFVSLVAILTWHMTLILRGNKINRDSLDRLALHFFGFLWIPWTACHSIIAYNWNYEFTGGMMAVMLLTSWIGDGAAFYFGRAFGKIKAFPDLSPNKTVEGIFATFVFSIFLCIVFYLLQSVQSFKFPPVSVIHYIVIGVIIAGFDVIGDICESFLKRLGNVKDSGSFFTGHGGVLDRFDSFYFVCPVAVYYLYYIMIPL